MKLEMFSVYDQKARAFCTPFFCPNEHVALRAFTSSANDQTTEIGRYPTDFSLFALGSFDDATGAFDIKSEPQHIALALTVVQPVEAEANV
jgi:hypothetical protein